MKKVIVGLIVILIIFLSGCQKIEEFRYSGSKGGTLIIAVLDEPSNLNPMYPSISGLSPVASQLFTPLISEKPDGKVRPALAETWVYSEDLKSITYTIAKGATWHDGKPITAEDVVFTVEQMLDNENKSPLAQKLVYVESVEALNSREVRFNLKQVFAGELQSTNIYPIPKHILVREDNLQNSDFNVEPVASGPFKLQEWNRGKWIEMVANPDYFRGRPPLDKMVFYTPSSMGELLSELVLGNVDLAYDLPPGNYDTLRSYLKILTPGRSYTYIGWNTARFPEKKLRQAFSMAIDRRKIISDVLGNYGQVVDGPITPEHWAYNPELKGLREDKEGSKKLFEELGYSKRKGQKFYQGLNVQILVEEGSDIRKKVAASIVSDLQAVGVQAGIVPLSGKDLLTRLFNKNFDAYILGWNVEKEFNPFQIWGSEGMYNFVGYKNSTIDNLIGEALLSLDREKAKKALYEFQNIIREDLPYTFLYAPKKITLVKKNIQGVSQDDKRPILSFVDELWFRSVSGTGVELASLGEKYRKGPVEETKPAKGTRETPEQVLMATAPTLVPEKKPTTSPASSAADADTLSESSEPPPFVAYEVPPKPLNLDRVEFPYPEVARKLGLNGTVYLELWISKEGNVTNVVLIRSVHPILDKVAVENAKQLRFSPAIQGNKPVAVRYSFPVRFQE